MDDTIYNIHSSSETRQLCTSNPPNPPARTKLVTLHHLASCPPFNRNSPLVTFKSKVQLQMLRFISILIQKCLSEVSLCQWQLNHSCGGSFFIWKQTGRPYPSKPLSVWMQCLRTSIRLRSTSATWKTVFSMSSPPPPPDKPIKYLTCKPLCIQKLLAQVSFSMQGFQKHSEFKSSILFSRAASCWKATLTKAASGLPAALAHMLRIWIQCHWNSCRGDRSLGLPPLHIYSSKHRGCISMSEPIQTQ